MHLPPIEPYDAGLLPVDGGNKIYWEASGNPNGLASGRRAGERIVEAYARRLAGPDADGRAAAAILGSCRGSGDVGNR